MLIVTVNSFLLAHAVLPHHHHNGIPHFYLFDSHNEHSDFDIEDECCCEHNDGETCVVEQDIDVISSNEKDCYGGVDCFSHNHPVTFFLPVIYSLTIDFSLVLEDNSPVEPPYLISYHFDYANSCLGLRAPPFLS